MLSRAYLQPRSVFAFCRSAVSTRIVAFALTRHSLVPCKFFVAPTPVTSPSLGQAGLPASCDRQHESNVELSSNASSALATISACPGCGALAQNVLHGEAGFYDLRRGTVRRYLKNTVRQQTLPDAGAQKAVFAEARSQDSGIPATELQALKKSSDDATKKASTPLCDRCHELLHHHTGAPIHHPSIESIQDTIAESPHTNNHIYHIIDAADFPMSLVPSIQRILSVNPLRTKNRRAKTSTYRQGRKTELSFIITRADLLAPRKEQVDRLMPYLIEVLRDALGRAAQGVRLGNVRCVSARRGWWTKELKADIWKRGGAGWMLGKVNVGKSNLFEVVFPKGNGPGVNIDHERRKASLSQASSMEAETSVAPMDEVEEREDSLLPPARLETPYPTMPTVSSLPGTTASPIRIPFGNGRGELIDLPGLARSGLEDFVPPESREQLVMKSRIAPEQFNLRPGQSLMLGDLIRISPRTTELNILAYPFVPLKAVVRSDQKLLKENETSTEADTLNGGLPQTIATGKTADDLKSAGRFALQWDVTKQRAGPLTRRDAVGLKSTSLPFKVLSTDILIESVGWVELVVQVRRKDYPDGPSDMNRQNGYLAFPEIEVFSPEGRFIGSRRPMGAWNLGKPLRKKPKKRVTLFSKLNKSKK